MGTYRTVYTDPAGKPGHFTKFGTGENLADTLALHQFAEEYPHLFEPEELHEMPGGTLQDWIMQSLKNPKEHILAPSMLERAKFPFTYTQREGVPLARTGDRGMQDEFDLHAWAELYIPGAGWRGFDPSGKGLIDERYLTLVSSSKSNLTAVITGNFKGRINLKNNLSWEIKPLEINK